MRQLRTCDFCGDDAVGTFEIVPPELDPTEAEQRRVVLCGDCQPTLEELLEPLLARAGAAPTGETGSEESADDAQSNGRTDRQASGTDDEHDDQSETRPLSTRDTEETTSRGTPGIETNAPDDEAGDVVTPSASERSTGDEGVAIQPGDRTADDTTPSATEAANANDDASTVTGAQAGTSNTPSAPKAYGKVLRLLQNREFPMARADVEALAAGAYDLEDHQVEAVVDHAVEQGDLIEDGRNVRLG
ncbi:hypothetical protein C479_08778 [Halovivax asiaticus JCM 14624]|uniref:Uncharacterized protein n=1 Tax=Halovivax asiaticus JCM 14624 TaxID=1227490 RepID=M0BKQ7_9EURY|nr:hypothetical protein [Halovivax asiaticus]ELZ10893.1 hypothetical protein C479_08778 [Halovivax asiaticus JCM 14624]